MQCGNAVWLVHSELSCIVSAHRTNKKIDRYNTGCIDTDTWFNENSLEFSFLPQETRFTNSGGLWIVEDEDQSLGGVVQSHKPFRLKHLSSGFFLSCKVESAASQAVTTLTQKGLQAPGQPTAVKLDVVEEVVFQKEQLGANVPRLVLTRNRNSGGTLFRFQKVKQFSTEPRGCAAAGQQLTGNEFVYLISC